MRKKIHYVKDSVLTFFTNMLIFIKNNKLILLGCALAVISVIVFKVYPNACNSGISRDKCSKIERNIQ